VAQTERSLSTTTATAARGATASSF
jgi:hypothetical protein